LLVGGVNAEWLDSLRHNLSEFPAVTHRAQASSDGTVARTQSIESLVPLVDGRRDEPRRAALERLL